MLGAGSVQTMESFVMAKCGGMVKLSWAQWLFIIGIGDQFASASTELLRFAVINRRETIERRTVTLFGMHFTSQLRMDVRQNIGGRCAR